MPERTVICLRGATWRMYPCDLWSGAKNGNGYGQRKVGGKAVAVHREALAQRLQRPIRHGMVAAHHCDTPLCRQPEHLYEGTPADNFRDALDRGQRMPLPPHPPALTDIQRAEVRRRYAVGGVSQCALAHEFGVTQTTISNVVTRKYLYRSHDDLPVDGGGL